VTVPLGVYSCFLGCSGVALGGICISLFPTQKRLISGDGEARKTFAMLPRAVLLHLWRAARLFTSLVGFVMLVAHVTLLLYLQVSEVPSSDTTQFQASPFQCCSFIACGVAWIFYAWLASPSRRKDVTALLFRLAAQIEHRSLPISPSALDGSVPAASRLFGTGEGTVRDAGGSPHLV
jgi:hypothetical protein